MLIVRGGLSDQMQHFKTFGPVQAKVLFDM